jgi:voltage-gated potassium channel
MKPEHRLILSLTMLVAVFLVATAGYVIIEGWPLGDAAYMTAITLSTVGFREIHEPTAAGRAWTGVVIVLGVAVVGFAFSSLQALVVSGDMRKVLGRRKLQTRIAQLSGHTIICGYGRMGRMIASELQQARQEIVVVDHAEEAIQHAEEDGLLYILGDAVEEDVLASAGVRSASALVSVLPSDADNVYVTLTARGIRDDLTIIARAEHPTTARKLNRAGATRAVCPHQIGATQISRILTKPHFVNFMESAVREMGLELDEYVAKPDSPLVGRTLREAAIRQHVGAMVVAVRHADGRTIFNPAPDLRIEPGDTLLMIGGREMAERLNELAHRMNA